LGLRFVVAAQVQARQGCPGLVIFRRYLDRGQILLLCSSLVAFLFQQRGQQHACVRVLGIQRYRLLQLLLGGVEAGRIRVGRFNQGKRGVIGRLVRLDRQRVLDVGKRLVVFPLPRIDGSAKSIGI